MLKTFIRKTCPCNVYPLKPHFYTEKLEYAGVYLFFLFLLQNIDRGYSEPHFNQNKIKNKKTTTKIIIKIRKPTKIKVIKALIKTKIKIYRIKITNIPIKIKTLIKMTIKTKSSQHQIKKHKLM